MPANIKTAVAIIERFDSLLIPQMPCPLVQPDPSRVPKPTSNPARISTNELALISISG
ncbi:Uncharacterised protein [Acinetobacter baumannii]|nr:hypothetical protein QU96_1629 [Acinetobacter baumannii]SSS41711.1 Uncharacterised protein [Acinetobacter baumannii]SSU49500.1 Uncharacterised protein [Acinetobacter baumannii]